MYKFCQNFANIFWFEILTYKRLSFCITLANFSWAVHRYRVGSEGTEMAEVTGAPQEQQQTQTVPV